MISEKIKHYNIEPKHITYNPSYALLYDHEISATGFERGVETESGAVAVDTGEFTGRSPKDKYIVNTDQAIDHVWWSSQGSDNQPIDTQTWQHLKGLATKQLSNQHVYVIDGFCGANPKTRLAVRLVTEVAWMAHFFKNMFIRPTESELATFDPDWVILNACKTACHDYQQWGLNSETFVAFNLDEKMTVIGNTWYGGEIKKGIFSMMNYFLPLEGIGSFHCSANVGPHADVAMFFGLSGTGKTTLSTDPNRALIGDDEHGWDQDGVFNLEGGCYAKTIALSAENEPDIYQAIRRNALLENVTVNQAGQIDFDDGSKTQNTRVSYPIHHIDNIVKPISKAGHPERIIFLTCDTYGVLPPVAQLNVEQALYQFLSGYTSKVAGTERGVTQPVAVFSACFGQPFLLLHPTKYAEILGQKMRQHQTQAYLINTGWNGGGYGVGQRISIKETRAIINAVLSGAVEQAPCVKDPLFKFNIPTQLPGVSNELLQPREQWDNPEDYDRMYHHLAEQFVTNFKRFTDMPLGQELQQYGPLID